MDGPPLIQTQDDGTFLVPSINCMATRAISKPTLGVEMHFCHHCTFSHKSGLLFKFQIQTTLLNKGDVLPIYNFCTKIQNVDVLLLLYYWFNRISVLFQGNVQFHTSNPHVNVSLGSLLDDQQWHSTVIERFGRQVNFTVDKHVHHFFMKGDISYLDIDYEVCILCKLTYKFSHVQMSIPLKSDTQTLLL